MKNSIACLSLFALMPSADAEPVSTSRTWTESYPVATGAPGLTIRNIWGNVRVRSGPPGTISLTVDEKRSAPTAALFERSLATLKLDVEVDADSVSVHVGDRDRGFRRHDACPGCRVDYQFDVSVPPGTRLNVGTVTDGSIDVAGIVGTVSASNVNGPVSVSDLSDCQNLESVNGGVDVEFSTAPGQDCRIETVNGDIVLSMPDGSGLNVALDLFNGQVFTEFEADSYPVPAQIERSTDNGRHRYSIQQSAGLRLEGGGPTFSIASLNGDIRFQKNR